MTWWSDSRCKGKDDSGLTRLAQYKVLEKKQRDKSEFAEGGHEFLLVLALAGADAPTQAAIEALGLPAAAYSSDFLRPAADNDVLILSNLGDAIACVYRHKSLSFHLPLDIAGIGHRDVTSLGQQQCEALFSELNLPAERRARLHEIVALVKQNYEFVGRLGEAAVKDNLRAIFARVPAAAKFFVLLPSDKSFKDGAPVFHQDRTRLREWIIEAAAPFSSVTLIDSNEFINHPDDVPGSPGHYGRAVYLKICNRVRQQLGR